MRPLTASDKLKTHRIKPGSSEWFKMWRLIDAGEIQEYGLSIKTKPCPLCMPNGIGCYKYQGTYHRSHTVVTTEWRRMIPEEYQFCHIVKHKKHPVAGKAVIRVVPASLNWRPE